jgi:hypothetical protein
LAQQIGFGPAFFHSLLTLVTGAALVCMSKRRAIGHWLLTLALDIYTRAIGHWLLTLAMDIYTRAIMVMAIVCWLCP